MKNPENPYFKPYFWIHSEKTLKFRLICTNNLQGSGTDEIPKQSHISSFFSAAIITALFLFLFLAIPRANAGIISFIGNLLNLNDPPVQETAPSNSQNISLLESPQSPLSDNATGGGDITIVNGNAVMANAGPMGTINDIASSTPSSDQISLYVVRKGDTLLEIANMFNVSINTIRWANNLKPSDSIKPGDTLIILPVTGVQYTVKKGDTIKKIASKYKGDVDEIISFNDLNPDEPLEEGQTIIIPDGDMAENQTPTSIPSKNVQKSYDGYYIRPIVGGRKSQGIHGYNAVDLANVCGTPIYASASGDVILSRDFGWNGGYGKLIIISHPNGTQTLYAHLSKTVAQTGWHVIQGQLIGYVGTTGHSTGCHLHFEIRGAPNPF